MNQANKYYAHSGIIGLMGPIYMVIFGSVGVLVLGGIYGYAIFYIPFIYLNFFITIGFGVGVGFLIGFGGRLGKVRNSKILILFGSTFGLLAVYAGWVSWLLAFSNQEAFILPLSNMLDIIQNVSQNGVWSIFGWTPMGAEIYVIWGIEAIMILGMTTIMAWAVSNSTPFCEKCKKWVEEEDSILPLDIIEHPNKLVTQLEQGDYSSLNRLNKNNTAKAYTKIDLLHCSTCPQSNFLTIKAVAISEDSKNKEQENESVIVENLIITSEVYETIKGQW